MKNPKNIPIGNINGILHYVEFPTFAYKDLAFNDITKTKIDQNQYK